LYRDPSHTHQPLAQGLLVLQLGYYKRRVLVAPRKTIAIIIGL